MDTQLIQFIAVLRRATGLLDDEHAELRSEVLETCDRVENPTCRIAVFGPFNYGKSTLLNALLGDKTLPMDLVPTTGAAITVQYGLKPKTRITRTNGSVQEDTGIASLEQYAVLDEQRRMKADIASVEVFCPHPLLKLGIELVDLPGTDDDIAQDALVQQQLLSADVVIQLLDGRKLMTLAERENLRDWLLDRGIETVIFVVNFLNLMEESDRQQVSLRLRFLAESFRATLPPGVSNLYQVDALPALRARLKGDTAAAAKTGLSELESAIQTIGQQCQSGQQLEQVLPRLKVLSDSILTTLKQQIEQLSIPKTEPIDTQKLEIKQKAQKLIQQGFEKDIAKLKEWLDTENLQAQYRLGLADALKYQTTHQWVSNTLRPAWEIKKEPVVTWVHQASEFFDQPCPDDMHIGFSIELEPEPKPAKETDVQQPITEEKAREGSGIGPVAIATGVGWILGGPLGAAVIGGTSHLVNESKRANKTSASPEQPIDYTAQADIYLARFSTEASDILNAYQLQATPILQPQLTAIPSQPSATQLAQRHLLQATANELMELMDRVSEISLQDATS